MTLNTDFYKIVKKVKNRISGLDVMQHTFGDLIDCTYYEDGAAIDAESIQILSKALEKNGLCSEPRIRKGYVNRAAHSPIYLYKQSAPIDTNSQSYRQGLLIVRVATIMAKADGEIDSSEYDNTINYLKKMPFLSADEVSALSAKAMYLLDSVEKYDEGARDYVRITLNRDAIMEKLPEMTKTASFILLKVAKEVAVADGHIARSELNLLQDMYRALGMSTRSTQRDLEKYAEEHYIKTQSWEAEDLIPEGDLDDIDEMLNDYIHEEGEIDFDELGQ